MVVGEAPGEQEERQRAAGVQRQVGGVVRAGLEARERVVDGDRQPRERLPRAKPGLGEHPLDVLGAQPVDLLVVDDAGQVGVDGGQGLDADEQLGRVERTDGRGRHPATVAACTTSPRR